MASVGSLHNHAARETAKTTKALVSSPTGIHKRRMLVALLFTDVCAAVASGWICDWPVARSVRTSQRRSVRCEPSSLCRWGARQGNARSHPPDLRVGPTCLDRNDADRLRRSAIRAVAAVRFDPTILRPVRHLAASTSLCDARQPIPSTTRCP